jgi:hypothetical protein
MGRLLNALVRMATSPVGREFIKDAGTDLASNVMFKKDAGFSGPSKGGLLWAGVKTPGRWAIREYLKANEIKIVKNTLISQGVSPQAAEALVENGEIPKNVADLHVVTRLLNLNDMTKEGHDSPGHAATLSSLLAQELKNSSDGGPFSTRLAEE